MSDEFDNHGHSRAAWTGVATILFGFLLSCIAIVAQTPWLFVVGAVICVIGVAAGKILSMMGFGQAKVAHDRDGIG